MVVSLILQEVEKKSEFTCWFSLKIFLKFDLLIFKSLISEL